jgi:nucleoside-diphosphate-sugar epimerase
MENGGDRMKVIIVGGTSFIGPPLVRRLVALGHHVAVFHRGKTQAPLPSSVEQILGDRIALGTHTDQFRRFGPDVVVDMIALTEADARGLVAAFRGLAQRSVVISSADVYRAYGRFIKLEPGLVEPTPLVEDAPLRQALFPYRVEQSIDTDSGRIRRELGYAEEVNPRDALERTIAWEEANPLSTSKCIGPVDYDSEDALIAEIGRSQGTQVGRRQ